MGAAGPLYAILGFLIFPFIWSIPEAMITAELSTTFPGNGGYVVWSHRAFGPFWGSLMGCWKFLCGVINLASFLVLCFDYIKLLIPFFYSGLPRFVAIIFTNFVLSFLNYTGLVIVGYSAVILGVASLLPFILMTLISIPRIDPSRWINPGVKNKNWSLFFNILFWNLNYWDNASTLAGEINQPQKTFPKALFSAGILSCLSYLIPLLAATGAIPLDQNNWVDGYFAVVAEVIAGKWLKICFEIGAVLSIVGLFEAQLSSCVYQLVGMADLGFLVPQRFSERSKRFDTPWLAILVSALITVAVSYLDNFEDLISSANFLYCLGMLLEFSCFLWLRIKLPTIQRPYKVPMNLPCLIAMCLVPCGFLVFVMSMATGTVVLVSCVVTIFAIIWYFALKFCKSKRSTYDLG